ncbi:AAA domain-containing protein [Thermogutta sp.]|uniref:AAA domain-containing protein n=1 Tax=Thermogutta sp. TaxID=1962930 RepID=UPI0032201F6A
MRTHALRERTSALLKFLWDYSGLRRRSGTTYTKDDRILWWADLDAELKRGAEGIDSPLLRENNGSETDAELWLEMQKLREPAMPEPPAALKRWIADYPNSLRYPPGTEPTLLSEIPSTGTALAPSFTHDGERGPDDSIAYERLEDHPEVQKAFTNYLEKWRSWRAAYSLWYGSQRLYSQLDLMRRLSGTSDETSELVMAFGLLEGVIDGQFYCRHLFVAPADIVLEPIRGKLVVRPSWDFTQFKLDLTFLPSHLRPDFTQTPLQDKLQELDCDLTRLTLIEELLNLVGNHLSPEIVIDPAAISPRGEKRASLSLRFAPALALRRRVFTGYEETVHQLIKGFEEGRFCETRPWQMLLLEGRAAPWEEADLISESESNRKTSKTSSGSIIPEEELYFPLPSNDQQRRIAQRLSEQPCVLVKGPPGTGKSQTIANLICHLLAQGHRLLITAQSAKALTVLREMLPEDIRDLCVIALGNSRSELKLMEDSVQRIVRRAEQWDELFQTAEIERLSRELRKCRNEIARLEKELCDVREAETRVDRALPGGYTGTAAQIAQKVRRRAAKYRWLPKEGPRAHFPLSDDDLEFFADWHAQLTPDRKQSLAWTKTGFELPGTEEIATLFHEYSAFQAQIQEPGAVLDASIFSRLKHLPDDTIEQLWASLTQLCRTIREASSTLGEALQLVIQEFAGGKHPSWLPLIRYWSDALKRLSEHSAFLQTTRVTYPDDMELREILAAAKRRAEHFRRGGKRRWLLFFTPRVVKETNFVEQLCRVNGVAPESLSELDDLIKYLEFKELVLSAFAMWPGKIDFPAGDVLAATVQLRQWQVQLVALFRAFETARSTLSMLPVQDWQTLFLDDSLQRWEQAITRERAHRGLARTQRRIEELASRLRSQHQESGDPAVGKCCRALENMDLELWQSGRDEYSRRKALIASHERYLALRERIENAYPALKNWLIETEGQASARKVIKRLANAWTWSEARAWLRKVTQPGRYQELKLFLEELRKQEREIIKQLASLKAWQAFMLRLDDRTRQNLQAWVKTIQRIGKGTGKRAPRLRREARRYLFECLPKIPVWIMPVHRVWETASVEPGIFDTIIVDEASQAGLDSLLLLLLGKRLVVVGDDQQNSPGKQFIEQERINGLIDRYLKGVLDFAENYQPDFSLYDHALRAFGLPITLREHFRCVPQIIRFSNDLCYTEEPLIPLRQAPPQSLPPLQAFFVPSGQTEGESPNIINRAEAEAIVEKIQQCLRDPAYKGKTIGVITLQGQAQMELIQRLLSERIEPQELEDRKLTCGTSPTFQGDQRDVIFLSLVVAPNQHFRALTTDDEKRRFNVAMSRARDQVWLFHSVRLEDLSPEDIRYKLCKFFYSPEQALSDGVLAQRESLETVFKHGRNRKTIRPPAPFESWFEAEVALALLRLGYRIRPQWAVAGYRIDLVVEGEQKRLGIECDGDSWHGREQFLRDLHRQLQLERVGWTIVRVRQSEFYANRKRCLEYILDKCRELNIRPWTESEAETPHENKRGHDDSELCDGDADSESETRNGPYEQPGVRKSLPRNGATQNWGVSNGGQSVDRVEPALEESIPLPSPSSRVTLHPAEASKSSVEQATMLQEVPHADIDGDDPPTIRYHSDLHHANESSNSSSVNEIISNLMASSNAALADLLHRYFPDDDKIWKKLAAWAKEKGLFTPVARKFLYKVGESCSPTGGWELTPKQKTWACHLFADAIKQGYLKEVGVEWLIAKIGRLNGLQ